MKLHIGCGNEVLDGWVNIDRYTDTEREIIGVDLDDTSALGNGLRGRFEPGAFTEMRAHHVLEHVTNILPLMETLWTIAAPDCRLDVRVPHAGHDDALEDPTHVRLMVPTSFGYFGQPLWRRAAPYGGYAGDWHADLIELIVDADTLERVGREAIEANWRHARNYVRELHAVLRAIKPARPTGEPSALSTTARLTMAAFDTGRNPR